MERITKKLMPALQGIDGAILMLNATDPQLETFLLFAGAVENVPNFIVLNKVDMVTETDAQNISTMFIGRQVVLASMKTGRGMDEIQRRLEEMSGTLVILGIFNSGKTSLINALTGEKNKVDDIPGTTLEFTRHPYKHLTLMDSVGQIIDVSKPLMVATDLEGCRTIEDKVARIMTEDYKGIISSINIATPKIVEAVLRIKEQVSLGHKVVTTGAGASALVARQIASQCTETGVPAMVFTNDLADSQPMSFAKGIGENEMGLARYSVQAINKGDVAIGVSASGGTGFVFSFLELAKSKGAFTVAITENSDTPLGKQADIIIKSNAKPEGPSSSKIETTHLAIAHALVIALADERGITAQKAIDYMMPEITRNKLMGIK